MLGEITYAHKELNVDDIHNYGMRVPRGVKYINIKTYIVYTHLIEFICKQTQ